jgi:D-glycero-D-manno-heptose 1,7-bisphosphate phosphatase
MNKKAIFFDRDNTLIIDTNYMHKLEDLKYFPDTIEVLKKFQDAGYILFIITNQSGVGRGYFTIEQMHAFNNHMLADFTAQGVNFTDLAYCPHSPDDSCDCRKPHPKLINVLCDKYQIDKTQSFMVGDKSSDVLAGENAGMTGILYESNLEAVAKKILDNNNSG